MYGWIDTWQEATVEERTNGNCFVEVFVRTWSRGLKRVAKIERTTATNTPLQQADCECRCQHDDSKRRQVSERERGYTGRGFGFDPLQKRLPINDWQQDKPSYGIHFYCNLQAPEVIVGATSLQFPEKQMKRHLKNESARTSLDTKSREDPLPHSLNLRHGQRKAQTSRRTRTSI